ncbi:Acetoacetyl-CoA synthetase [Vanrija pseudolonga]|uniref:Acetoacetyl-CoA synthetase n=1 Tax=Vanrija pseudolonga TaxID=143232 RepID=A0AAF0YFF5_9TREE|nr:Acetoacetyl-CoA synthetase [Vanrija pseudolonga]
MTTTAAVDSDLLWLPAHPERAQSTLLREKVAQKYGLKLETYEDLLKWSIEHRGDFWSEVWDWEGVLGDKGAEPFVDETVPPRSNPLWFPKASINWAENQLRHAKTHPDDIAVIDTTEHSPSEGYTPAPRRVTQRELLNLVGQVQRGLKAAGVKKGHRVCYWGGNRVESVAVLLATNSIGAIFSSAAADFGVDGVIERLEQIKPHVLFASNGVVYNGKARPLIQLLPKLFSALKTPPSTTVIINHLPDSVNPQSDVSKFLAGSNDPRTKFQTFESFVGTEPAEPTFERGGFNDPIWILFSSGTTGKPKAIVHRQGGMLLDSLREHHIQGDITRGDVFFYYTTPGWMMFQYLVSGLATGATIVCYEGSPLKDPATMWNMIDEHGVTAFGTSAKYIEQISKHYPDVGKKHKLATLRQIMSTGSPLAAHLFDFVYENVKKDVLLGSVTGGTDICSVFAGRCTSLPVFRGEIQCRMLGFALDTTTDASGDAGELIVRRAFPIEPVGFWPLPRDSLPDGQNIAEADVKNAQERFLDSYFKDEEGNWYHGDYVQITPSRYGNGGGFIMLGRSDGVLNPSGIRFGPTDIYSVLENPAFAERGVEETLVVGLLVEGGSDEKVVLFVKMRPGKTLDPELLKLIKDSIRTARSARHVPAKIIEVADIPMTLTGKKIEVPIRKVINGSPVSAINPATLRNPDCLEEYVALGLKMRQEEGMA